MSHENNPWAKEAEEGQKKKSDIIGMTWKPGDHTIRICPNLIEKNGLPFVKYIVHWIPIKTSIKNRPIIHSVDYKCPVCDFVSLLWSEVYRLKEEENMNDESPEVKKIKKQINIFHGKKTYDMNIIHREDATDDKGRVKIKRLVAGPTIWKPIIELGNSAKWGNPSSEGPRGYDITVTVTGEKIKREYTTLPDSERTALTAEEIEAIKTRGYNLKKLRDFSTVEEMIDVIENAKPPLDTISLKKLKKQLKEDSDSNDEKVEVKNDDEDSDVKIPASTEVDEDESDSKEVESTKDVSAFSNKEVSENTSEEATEESNDDSTEETITLDKLDCRGTHDKSDVGCQECPLDEECKQLKSTFKAKSDELGITITNLSGVEIEKLIKEKSAKTPVKTIGKAGKQNTSTNEVSTPVSTATKRKVPF